MCDRITWRTSGFDGKSHIFMAFGRTYSATLCAPTIPHNRIIDAPDEGRCAKCEHILNGPVPGSGPRGSSEPSQQPREHVEPVEPVSHV